MQKETIRSRVTNTLQNTNYPAIEDIELMDDKKKSSGLEKISGTYMIPIDLIKVSPERLRNNPESGSDIEDLAEPIKKHKIIQPLTVKKDNDDKSFVIIIGERRYWAAKKTGLKKIPCIIKNGLNDEEIYLQMITENLHRKNLSPFEEAKAYKVLIDKYNYNQKRIAKEFGKQESHVSEILKLFNIPELLINKITDEKIFSTEKLVEIAKQKTPKEMNELAEGIKTNNLTVPETRKVSKQKRVGETSQNNNFKKVLKKSEEFKKTTELLKPDEITEEEMEEILSNIKTGESNIKKVLKKNS